MHRKYIQIHRVGVKSFPDYKYLLQENQGKTLCSPCISNKMQRYTVYLYLETALHVSGGTTTHHRKRKQLYLRHLLFTTPLLLPTAIAAGSSNGVINTIAV